MEIRDDALSTRCDPASYEKKWYAWWHGRGLFAPDPDRDATRFSMVIPPPNVTGVLHMGHALDNTYQDVLLRYNKLQGRDCLWVPGMDHAGIATQNVVERQLQAEGLTRHDVGREKFVERVWQWKEESGGIIKKQLETLGVGVDWTRERFTMDDQCRRAVRRAFKQLYDEGLIYQARRMINWCPRCKTALSDIEVEHTDDQGAFYHIKYPVAGEPGAFIEIATTRPETMLGDSAVAVHPDDERYTQFHGKKIILPLVNREMPLILDEYVDREFGTGALKVTPAHDPNDFDLGLKHGLPQYVMMDEDGNIAADYPAYAGMDRFECRKKIVVDLKAAGLFIKEEPHTHSVGHCSRCRVTVEPYVSLQWFVRMKELAGPAMDAVRDGRTRFVPERWSKVYLDWLENIRDWCISRQLWWGHRIPVWTCADCGKQSCDAADVDKCQHCGSAAVTRDEDVLDTWFSSGLWPLSTMGWPENTIDYQTYYPTSVLVTGFDIIFFWVARMMFFGLKFGGDVPFRTVFIHGLVRDEHGRKISKSLGNAIDPLTVCDEYGTDALRFTFLSLGSMGQDVNLSDERFKGSRNFCNKLWNAARFILMSAPAEDIVDIKQLDPAALDVRDRWILSRAASLVRDVRALMDAYDLNESAQRIYQFLWHDFCDWYIELSKEPLRNGAGPARTAAATILHTVLRWNLTLLHPFMPFITEEIYSHLPGTAGSILEVGWPGADWPAEPEAEAAVSLLQSVVRAARDLRVGLGLAPNERVEAILRTTDPDRARTLETIAPLTQSLAGISEIQINADPSAGRKYMSAVTEGVEIFMPVDEERTRVEIERLEKKRAQLGADCDKINRKLDNPDFISRAPETIVSKERNKYDILKADIAAVEQRLHALGSE